MVNQEWQRYIWHVLEGSQIALALWSPTDATWTRLMATTEHLSIAQRVPGVVNVYNCWSGKVRHVIFNNPLFFLKDQEDILGHLINLKNILYKLLMNKNIICITIYTLFSFHCRFWGWSFGQAWSDTSTLCSKFRTRQTVEHLTQQRVYCWQTRYQRVHTPSLRGCCKIWRRRVSQYKLSFRCYGNIKYVYCWGRERCYPLPIY